MRRSLPIQPNGHYFFNQYCSAFAHRSIAVNASSNWRISSQWDLAGFTSCPTAVVFTVANQRSLIMFLKSHHRACFAKTRGDDRRLHVSQHVEQAGRLGRGAVGYRCSAIGVSGSA
jgi:hypothetical protein